VLAEKDVAAEMIRTGSRQVKILWRWRCGELKEPWRAEETSAGLDLKKTNTGRTLLALGRLFFTWLFVGYSCPSTFGSHHLVLMWAN
jgi:hypothetical protein